MRYFMRRFIETGLKPVSTAIFFLFFAFKAFALAIPSVPNNYVNDYAQMFSGQTVAQLNTALKNFENRTSTQIMVATFPSLEGENLEDFSIRLAEKWQAGQKNKDNGVILLIIKNDRKARIEVGYGLEGALPDATSKLILARVMAPAFQQGHFDQGVTQTVQAIMQATQGEYKASPAKSNEDNFQGWFFLVVFVLIWLNGISPWLGGTIGTLTAASYALFYPGAWISALLLWGMCLLVTIGQAVLHPQAMAFSKTGKGKHSNWWIGGGGFGGGGGGFGGGGFGGGGGGGFGGGGASGGW